MKNAKNLINPFLILASQCANPQQWFCLVSESYCDYGYHEFNSMNVKYSLFLFIFCAPHFGFSQFDSLGLNSPWNKGEIILDDNSILKGYIRNNDKLGLVKFKKELTDDEERSFHEKRISSMEYFDEEISKKRKFYTFNVDDGTGLPGAILFEIVMEMNHFAVLSKKQRVVPAVRNYSNDTPLSYRKVGYEQLERIYLVGEDAKAELLLAVTEFERDKAAVFAQPIAVVFNKKVLEKYTGSKKDEIKDFVKKNKLHLKRKDDVLMTLDYFYQLEKSEEL
jgi:hypothetical protein